MKITFLGGAGTVTGSQHLVEVNGYRILLDCGLFQGKRKEAFEINRRSIGNGARIDALVLSHAHIDHSGGIPCLVKNGFKNDIYATPATRDLCSIMLLDSAGIQEHDVAFVNKRRSSEGKNLFEPLYTKDDALAAMELFTGLAYNRRKEVLPGVFLTFRDAGHLLGSSHVILEVREKTTTHEVRLVFSGDIGRPGVPIIRDPLPVTEGADVLLMESTYGNRLHPPVEDSAVKLAEVVNETMRRGGTLLVPAFAVGRTQQIVYELHKLHNRGAIPAIPIYIDSPLATSVTDIYRLHQECFDGEIRKFLETDDDQNPFGFGMVRYVHAVEESKKLNADKEPKIIISASGMLEAGRILHHLRHRISDPRHTILITGWQAVNTLGRRIVDRQKEVKIFGEVHALKARVEVMTGMSGHADRDGLLAWAGAMERKPRNTFVIHGEEESAGSLADGLSKIGFGNIAIPKQGEASGLL